MENGLKLQGIVLAVTPLQQITDKFSKRDLVIDITDNPSYPNTPSISFSNKGLDSLEKVSVGDEVIVYFNLRGRVQAAGTKYGGQVFTNIDGWKVEIVKYAGTETAPVQPQNSYASVRSATPLPISARNGLPVATAADAYPDDMPF